MLGFINNHLKVPATAFLLLGLFAGCTVGGHSVSSAGNIDCGSQTWTIRVHEGVDIVNLAREYHSKVVWRAESTPGLYAIKRPCISTEDLKTDPLARDKRVLFLEHQVARQRHKRPEAGK